MQIVGKGYPVHDARLKVSGAAKYTADIKLPHMLHAKLLLSPKAHARISHIDASLALALEGVRHIATYQNTPQTPFCCYQRFEGQKIIEDELLFGDIVRFVGDRVAAVAADTPEIAAKAAKLIKVQYEELPAVFDVREALQHDAPTLHGKSNKIAEIVKNLGDIDKGFADSDFIFEDEYRTPPVHHLALETHCAIADYSIDGKLTVWAPSQNIFAARLILSKLFGLPINQVRIVKPPLGGAFGGKVPMGLDPIAALLSKETGRPVKIVFNRKETFIATSTRHASWVRVKTGVRKNGSIISQKFEYTVNTGAYSTAGISVAAAPSDRFFKLYKIPNLQFIGVPVYSNMPPAGAMRGYGGPQAYFAQQTHLHRVARELGMDFVEFQRKNLIEPDTPDPWTGESMGNPRPLDCVEKGSELFGWSNKRQTQPSGANGKRRGIGMAVGAHNDGVFGIHVDASGVRLTMTEDGGCILHTCSHEMGNGAVTVQKMIVAEELGITPDKVGVVESDTDSCLWSLGDFASRGVFIVAEAVRQAAVKMRGHLLKEAAKLMGRAADTLELTGGRIQAGDRDASGMSLKDLMTQFITIKQQHPSINHSYASKAYRTSYGAHFAEVEVDTSTGMVKVLDYAAVHDMGKVLNPLSAEGQLEGAVQMGLGFGLSEEMVFDQNGRLKNGILKRYRTFRALDMPPIRIGFIEEPDLPGPYGAKSVSEIATTPVAPAVVNAVADALGVDFHQLPLSPERVKQAIKGQ